METRDDATFGNLPADPPGQHVDSRQLADSIDRLTSELSGQIPRTASIKIPDESHLTVRLVNANTLQRLDEARGDANLHQGFFFTFFGALLGCIISVIVSNISISQLGTGTYITLASLLLMCGTQGAFAWRSSQRVRALKKQIFLGDD